MYSRVVATVLMICMSSVQVYAHEREVSVSQLSTHHNVDKTEDALQDAINANQRYSFGKNLVRHPFRTLAKHWAQGFIFGNVPQDRAEMIIENALRIRYLFCLDISDEQLKQHLQKVFIVRQEVPWKRNFVINALSFAFSKEGKKRFLRNVMVKSIVSIVGIASFGALLIYGPLMVKVVIVFATLVAGVWVGSYVISEMKKRARQRVSRPGKAVVPKSKTYGQFHKKYGVVEFDHRYFADMVSWHEQVHALFRFNKKRDKFSLDDFLAKEYSYVITRMDDREAKLLNSKRDIAAEVWSPRQVEQLYAVCQKKMSAGFYDEDWVDELYDEPQEIIYALRTLWDNPLDMVFFLSLDFSFARALEWGLFTNDLRAEVGDGYASLGDFLNRNQEFNERYEYLMRTTEDRVKGSFPVVKEYIKRKLDQIVTDLPRLGMVESLSTYLPPEEAVNEVQVWQEKLDPWWKVRSLGWKVVEPKKEIFRAA